ncbi:glycosyltransferase family 4 protein [Candidatus Uhrbacteria bacterium]|nr:glycosyltransferase family 4 protein [Candidatus Uhrbacteria bacterium]
MRIAYLTCVYPPYPGGIGIVTEGLAREMSKRGHEVHVFTPRQKGHRPQATGYRLHELRPWLRFGNAALLPQVLWWLKNFDVIHVLYPFFGVAEFVPLLKHMSRAKIVVHHTMDAVDSRWRGHFFRWHARYIMPSIFRAAHRVIVLSEDYAHNSEVEKLKLRQVDIVPNGVDTELFQPVDRNSKLEIRNSESQFPVSSFQFPIILFVGGLDRAHYFKGVEVLIEACRILKDREVKFSCQIIGEGEMRKKYERQAAGLAVEFVGLVPHEHLPNYYQNATVAVVPSTERVECFSIVAAEAQACGIPAIVSDFPGVRVTIEDGKTGYVVRPGDAEELAGRIQEMVANPEKAQAMGQAGRVRSVELYSWYNIGDKLDVIYKVLKNQTQK